MPPQRDVVAWEPPQLAELERKRLAALAEWQRTGRCQALPASEQKALFWLKILRNHVRAGAFTPERGEFAAERIARGEDFQMTPEEKANLQEAAQEGQTGWTIDTGNGPKPATGAAVMRSLARVLHSQARQSARSALAATMARSAPRARESRPAARRQRVSSAQRDGPGSSSGGGDDPPLDQVDRGAVAA